MKSANEDSLSCSMFRKHINAFIDDELNKETREKFLAHSAGCMYCKLLLKESIYIKKVLAHLLSISASTDFDYRLKARIRLETTLLKNPFHRFKLFLNDNLKKILTVPAVSFLILGIIFSYSEVSFNKNTPPVITQNKLSSSNSDFISPAGEYPEEEIHYVLDKVKSSEVETGIFLNEQDMQKPMRSTNQNLTLTSF